MLTVISIFLMALAVLPVVSYLVAKWGTVGYLKAKERQTNKERKDS